MSLVRCGLMTANTMVLDHWVKHIFSPGASVFSALFASLKKVEPFLSFFGNDEGGVICTLYNRVLSMSGSAVMG